MCIRDSLRPLRPNQSLEQKSRAIERQLAGCADLEQMRAILDGRVAEIKEFVGEIVKALPRPARIECERKLLGMRKVVRLEFVCPRTKHALAIESRDWSLWLKFAYSLAKTGFHVLTGDLVAAVEADAMELVKGAHGAYRERERDAEAFDALMRQPFLLATERDKLIEGLRKNGFFREFEYDAQAGAWVKRGYAGDAGAARAAADAATLQVEEAKARAEAEERERAEAEETAKREAEAAAKARADAEAKARAEAEKKEKEAAAAAAKETAERERRAAEAKAKRDAEAAAKARADAGATANDTVRDARDADARRPPPAPPGRARTARRSTTRRGLARRRTCVGT